MSFNESKKIFLALKEFEADITNMVTEMGNIAYNMTLETFRNQGFTDNTLQRWEPRKRTERGRGQRGILIGLGTGTAGLRGSYRKVRRGLLTISIINNKVYSGVHNEGLRAGRGTGFIMPERRMIGDSAVMNKKIRNKLNFRIKKIWQN